jgi:uncharacterized protein
MAEDSTVAVQPLAPCIKLDAVARPFLQGLRCANCAEVFLEDRRACPNCAALNSLRSTPLSDHGTVFSFTIVHRSFPHIKTPFISVVVALAGGGYIKGNLENVTPTPQHVSFNMPVRVKFERLPAHASGTPDLLRYYFVPLGAAHE